MAIPSHVVHHRQRRVSSIITDLDRDKFADTVRTVRPLNCARLGIASDILSRSITTHVRERQAVAHCPLANCPWPSAFSSHALPSSSTGFRGAERDEFRGRRYQPDPTTYGFHSSSRRFTGPLPPCFTERRKTQDRLMAHEFEAVTRRAVADDSAAARIFASTTWVRSNLKCCEFLV